MISIEGIDPKVSVVPRLTVSEIRTLGDNLPEPASRTVINGVQFDVFKVTDLFASEWSDMALFRLLLEARSSYSNYGDRPPIDEYDAKAAVYLVRVQYSLTEEWLSLRFVPGEGTPPGAGELDLFSHKNKPIEYCLHQTRGF